MSREPTNTDFHAGDFISEKAVRTVASGVRPLRRWSVAELLARAVALPRSTT